MKRFILLCVALFPTIVFSGESQFQVDFQRRFGPDSPVYNEPLYFASTKQRSQKDKRPKCRFRDQLRKRMKAMNHNKKREIIRNSSKSALPDPSGR